MNACGSVRNGAIVNKCKLNVRKCQAPLTLRRAEMQDLPPKGGFEALPYRRHLPARGPSGAVLLTAVASVVLTGLCLSRRSTAIIQYGC